MARSKGRSFKSPPIIAGERVGYKRSDYRFRDEHGVEWASKFEAEVFYGISKQGGYAPRKASPEDGDSFSYHSSVRNGVCLACDARRVVTERSYTPDIHIPSRKEYQSGYYIEAKGHLDGARRKLLRDFVKARPDIPLRLVFQRDLKVGKGTLLSWAITYLKVPAIVWKGQLPEEWG